MQRNMVNNTFQLVRSKVRLNSNVAADQKIISTTDKQQELNEVELIGKIHKRLYAKPSGYTTYVVLTAEPGNRFYYHMVGTGPINQCEAGQRVHLMGGICSHNYWTDDGQLRQRILLKCGKFERLPSDDKQCDLNRVRLIAQIASEVHNDIEHSSFTLTTRQTPKGGKAAGIFVTDYHRIIVRKPSLLHIVRQNLQIGDWVDVTGKVSYEFMKNSNNKLRQSGFILANNIQRK